MIYGILDAAKGQFRYVSAGHPGRASSLWGSAGDFGSDGFPLGLTDEPYEKRSIQLGAGDRLYLYSDGATEAMDGAGQQFGNVRMLESVGQGRSQSLQGSRRRPRGNITRWQEGVTHKTISPAGA